MPSSLKSFKVVDCPGPISLPTLSLSNLAFLSPLKLEPQDPPITSHVVPFVTRIHVRWQYCAAKRKQESQIRNRKLQTCVFAFGTEASVSALSAREVKIALIWNPI
jgi:hypothetical protein